MFGFTRADVGVCRIGIFERLVDAKHRCAEIDVIGDDRFDTLIRFVLKRPASSILLAFVVPIGATPPCSRPRLTLA